MRNGFENYSLRKMIYYLRYTEFTALARMVEHKLLAPYFSFRVATSEQKFCLLISGCPGDPYRYRCEHQAAQLASLGLTTDICYASQISDNAVVDHYQWVWLHRVSYNDRIEALMAAAQRSGKPVVFDIDDLVFDEKFVPYMREIEQMTNREVEQVYERAKGYYKTMARCNFATASTDDLRAAVVNLFPDMRCFVTPNMLSDAQLALAEQALKMDVNYKHETPGIVTIAYFSGTRTHSADFRECSTALAKILESYPRVRLILVGYLDIGREFARFGRRVECHRFVPWQRLASLFTKVDVNLAPLELKNPFTACKSDLKYFEAAIMGIPTVASAVGSYMKSIHHGENGYLCQTVDEWFTSLSRLVEDATLRQRMGGLARQLVLDTRTINRGGRHLSKTLLASIKDFKLPYDEVALVTNPRKEQGQ